jgi:hypothetical protein
LVPKASDPTDVERLPIDPNPPLSMRITVILIPSCSAVTRSDDIMSHDPSPTMT